MCVVEYSNGKGGNNECPNLSVSVTKLCWFFCFSNEKRMKTRLYHLRIQRLEKQVQIEFPSSVVLVPVLSAIIISKSCMYQF